MDLKFVTSLEKKIWRDYVDHHPQGNIFHSPQMFDVFEQAQGYRPAVFAVIDDNSQVQALMPLVQVTLINGILRRVTTRAIGYGGLLSSPGAKGEEALAILLGEYTKKHGRNALFTEIRNLADVSPQQPMFTQFGFAFEEHLDYLIDLRGSVDQVMQNIGSRTRQHIRRGLRKGRVMVEQITDRSQLSTWYDLVLKTYQAAGVPLADRSLFEAAFDILHPQGMVVFWLARVGSDYAAASVELLYKDIIYGWYGGVDRSYAADVPGELLMWQILKWGSENGYCTYDFGGAGKPNEEYGVRDFKAKFGGKLVCFGRNTWIPHYSMFRLSKAGYDLLRNWL